MPLFLRLFSSVPQLLCSPAHLFFCSSSLLLLFSSAPLLSCSSVFLLLFSSAPLLSCSSVFLLFFSPALLLSCSSSLLLFCFSSLLLLNFSTIINCQLVTVYRFLTATVTQLPLRITGLHTVCARRRYNCHKNNTKNLSQRPPLTEISFRIFAKKMPGLTG